MKIKKKFTRIISYVLAFVMLVGLIPTNSMIASAATQKTVGLTSLGKKGSVSYGSKTKSGTWWKMNVGSQEAFCINLGDTCHAGNTYEVTSTHKWDQDTGGEKYGYFAKVIRWYVLSAKRSNKAFVMSQALIWSISEGRNSASQLKDVIKQVKSNTGYYSSKSVDDLYDSIFKPSGSWTAEISFWQKTGSSKGYQKLMTVDADNTVTRPFYPKKLSTNTYYRQRVTVNKADEDGKRLGGIQFTLSAHNLDDLYSFSMTDRNGTVSDTADDDNDTSFALTGKTTDNGRIAYRMTYRLSTMDYFYFTEDDLAKMTADEKKAAKQILTDDYELDEGVDFGKDMTKEQAQDLADKEIKALKGEICNTYTLTEDNTGDNKNIVMDPAYAKGVNITLTKANSWYKDGDGNWPDTLESSPADYSLAYKTGVTNNYKKASMDVVKIDKYSKDKKPHGDANLEGAQFQLYADAACSTVATVYDSKGTAKTAGTYTIQNGKLTTDYLRSGLTYYLKESKAPVGYTLANDVLPIAVDASGVTAEYTSNLASHEYGNQPVLGKVAIQKYYSDGDTGELSLETNATFQVYLTSKESFDACDEYERAQIRTDDKGYAITGDLYYGKYTVHQVDSGDVDAIPVKDFPVEVAENGKVYTYPLNNTLFKSYLRILKKDGNTEKQVLKKGTTYQIYKVVNEANEEKEELVEQSYSNGNKIVKVDKFTTDETGEVMTVKPLHSAKYRIYETDSASGLHITEKFIEVTINSKGDNYESFVDEEGNTHIVVTVTYTNEETYGKLSIAKTGEMLSKWDSEKKEFVYENQSLKGAKFEIYADGDIVTQDNQGTTWFQDGDKVATITSGEKATFTSECNGICTQSLDEDGVVHLTLPLGKYKVKEVETLYGYVFPDKHEWSVEFNWKNSQDEYVLNSTADTNEKGVLNVQNDLAKPVIELLKEDVDSKEAIHGAVFGLYSKNDIYNAAGEKIVAADAELTTLTTGEDGTVKCEMRLPMMDQAYMANDSVVTGPAIGKDDTVSGEASTSNNASGDATMPTTDGAIHLNSGDYYLKEISVPNSYYLDETTVPVHLEYKDAETKVITAKCIKTNKQTTNEISKLSVAGSSELPGCELTLTDETGKEIVNWISGEKDSVKVAVTEADGYVNLKTSFDDKGNLHIAGLFHDKEYTLTEKRPADGYVTADAITYMLKQHIAEDGTVSTVVAIKQADGSFVNQADDKTIMIDEQTKIRLIKLDDTTGQGLAGAKFKVTDADGKEVMSFTSTDDGVDITGKLVVGQTYTFTEISAPKGYKIAKPMKYTVKDIKEVQSVVVSDQRVPTKTPPVPQTGGTTPMIPLAIGFILTMGVATFILCKKKRGICKTK